MAPAAASLRWSADSITSLDYLNAATGWAETANEFMTIGLRMQTLRQAFDVREGINPRDFKMNERLSGNPPLTAGPLKGKSFDMDAMMSVHYQFMGWDKNRHPDQNRPFWTWASAIWKWRA